VEPNVELEKSIADIQFLVDEFKDDVQKNLDEFNKVQSDQTERLEKIENAIESEIQNIKDLVNDLNQKFETFKQETSNTIEQSLASSHLKSDNLNQILDEAGHGLKELGQLKEQIDQLSQISPEKLREELIGGIRMLGERVSKAIADINERIDNFTDEIHAKVNSVNRISDNNSDGTSNQEGDDFATIKESKLLDVNDFEIVPREAIKRLTELFKKQSAAVKCFIGENEKKIQDFEQLLKTYDDENTRLLELLDRRVKRNFFISMAAIIFVILCSIAMRIF
jgi:archaellum component FlaC